MTNIDIIKSAVSDLLGNNTTGHDDKHVFRVYNMAMRFCDTIPQANRDLVAAAALLHDCDDYKLFGEESERLLTNTKRILAKTGLDNNFCEKCINIIKTIGYSKRLQGITPDCIEGQIVSDADMADAAGFIGIIRCIEYRSERKDPFFDPNWLPGKIDAKTYRQPIQCPVINHLFDKGLHLRDMALTEPGKQYINRKHQILVNFLDTFFDEVDAPKAWKDLLAQYK